MIHARDYLITADGLGFSVLSQFTEQNRIPCALRYQRNEQGWSKLSTEQAKELLRVSFPEYLYRSQNWDTELAGIPPTNSFQHRSGKQLARFLLADESEEVAFHDEFIPDDSVVRDARRSLRWLIAEGIEASSIGVSGSLLLPAHHSESDIDVWIDCPKNFHRARVAVEKYFKENPAAESLWQAAYDRRSADISLEEYLWHEKRKRNKFWLGKRKVDLSLNSVPKSTALGRGEKLGRCHIAANITSDTHGFGFPAVWGIEPKSIDMEGAQNGVNLESLRWLVCWTATYTGQALEGEFIEAQGDQPWLCHLSYIKPHWPYLAPAPYNDLYAAGDLPPVNRGNRERQSDHPLMWAWMDMRVSQSFSRDDVRDLVAPVYMGLIRELDDQMGRLFDYLEKSGRMDDTMIVFCSDHGDNMGDHWMGEKDLFYDCSARIPLIVFDPRSAADETRGAMSEALIEGIDLAPTFVDFFGGPAKPHILEGRSL
ncbi:MAG: sulfatase-like hydrolase/transferase, partial [Planctomycetota bacterium]